MWVNLFIFITIFFELSFSHQSGELVRKIDSKDHYIDPNDWSHNGHLHLSSKRSAAVTPYDGEVLQFERGCSSFQVMKKSIEKTVMEYVTLRRFVNLLLRRAKFEDVAGNIVPLESVSRSKNDKLVMSFIVYARPKEVQSLLDFGRKKTNPHPRQIDEILTNLTSTPELDLHFSKCQNFYQHWIKDLGSAWRSMTAGIDIMVVVFMVTVCYVVWSVSLVLTRGGSWKRVICCFIVPSLVWEFSKRLEEEKVKQYSDELRLGAIPDHCLGLKSGGWWEMIVGGNTKEQCYEHHLTKMGHSVLKVSIFKIAMVHLEQLVGLFVKFIKDLTASSPDDGWFTNMLMRSMAWLCITIVAIAVIIYYISRSLIVYNMPLNALPGHQRVGGSRVQPLEGEPEETEEVRPPVRRRRHAKAELQKRRSVEQTDGRQGDAHDRVCCCCGNPSADPCSPSTAEHGSPSVGGKSGTGVVAAVDGCCPFAVAGALEDEGGGDGGKGEKGGEGAKGGEEDGWEGGDGSSTLSRKAHES